MRRKRVDKNNSGWYRQHVPQRSIYLILFHFIFKTINDKFSCYLIVLAVGFFSFF